MTYFRNKLIVTRWMLWSISHAGFTFHDLFLMVNLTWLIRRVQVNYYFFLLDAKWLILLAFNHS